MLTKTQERQLQQAAARGARALDKVQRGWWRRVRTQQLRMSSATYCVVGQAAGMMGEVVFGTGSDPDDVLLARMCIAAREVRAKDIDLTARVQAQLPNAAAERVGYCVPSRMWDELYGEDYDGAWQVLQAAWVAEIAARRKAARARVAA